MSEAQTALVTPTRSIGPFTSMLVVEETASDDLEITQHPVQQGAAITDHAYVKPATVTVKFLMAADDAPLTETYAKLLALQSGRVPFDVMTGKRLYRNMLARSLALTTDRQTEHVLSITAQLQEINVVAVEIVNVPARHKHKSPGTTGATQSAGTKKLKTVPKSIIKAGFGS